MCNGLVKVILLRQFHFCFVFVLFVGMFLSLSCSNPPIIDWPWLALVLVLSVLLLLLLLFVFACCLLWSFDMFCQSCCCCGCLFLLVVYFGRLICFGFHAHCFVTYFWTHFHFRALLSVELSAVFFAYESVFVVYSCTSLSSVSLFRGFLGKAVCDIKYI